MSRSGRLQCGGALAVLVVATCALVAGWPAAPAVAADRVVLAENFTATW